LIGNKRDGGKAQRKEGRKEEPFVCKYLSHPGWFIGLTKVERRMLQEW